PDRFEWFVEKAVEIGVTEISCLQCEHSERFTVKAERMERLMVSAMKQSLHFRLPLFHPAVPAKDFIRQQNAGQRFIAWCGSDAESLPLKQACRQGGGIVVMIGPEGDFSPEEVRLARECGFQTVSLGNSRLRTETAAVVACTIVHCIHM
ncbi:MAG: RNA methyltransferase, partial [Bacteroidales bacterium]|nr:RNA methyltransferase [Bacteroidales bacterium]